MPDTRRVFRPRLVPSLVTAMLLPVLVGLGIWQLDRAEQKRQLLAEQHSQEQLPPVSLTSGVPADLSPFRKVRVSGQFDTAHSFLLDNKTHQGRAGYQVLTPLRLADGKTAILVNRGWVPMGASRDDLPRIETPASTITVSGRMIRSDKAPLQLSEDNIAGDAWPMVIQWTDYRQLEQRLGYALLPYLLLQDPDNPAGYVRDWSIAWIRPEKSTSYAVQWFMLAAALVIIFVVVNLRKVKKSE